MSARYVLEGEWSGYNAGQRHVVHREVVTGKRLGRLMQLHAIQYTDGTTLTLRVRPAKPREKVETINAYGSLIRECEAHGGAFVRVADLREAS